jgi:hypothetical protein
MDFVLKPSEHFRHLDNLESKVAGFFSLKRIRNNTKDQSLTFPRSSQQESVNILTNFNSLTEDLNAILHALAYLSEEGFCASPGYTILMEDCTRANLAKAVDITVSEVEALLATMRAHAHLVDYLSAQSETRSIPDLDYSVLVDWLQKFGPLPCAITPDRISKVKLD